MLVVCREGGRQGVVKEVDMKDTTVYIPKCDTYVLQHSDIFFYLYIYIYIALLQEQLQHSVLYTVCTSLVVVASSCCGLV